jgi:hypothetical protein
LENTQPKQANTPIEEDAAARAMRLSELLRVRLKNELAQRGSAEAMLHWLRFDREKI